MYKHLEGQSTGEIAVTVKPGHDVYMIANTIASQCRIPEAAVFTKGPNGTRIRFPLVWQREGSEVFETQEWFGRTLEGIPGMKAAITFAQAKVLSEEEVGVTPRRKEPHGSPHLRVVA